jgi:hypothetical protein
MVRIVKNRSIPNVDTARLHSDLAQLHEQLHTTEGLRSFDMPRRSLVDLGMKTGRIAAELRRRGESTPACRFCDGA